MHHKPNPVATIDPHNHAGRDEIKRVHGPGEDVHDEINRLEQLADMT